MEWISVEDRLPPEDEDVLLSAIDDGERRIFVAYWSEEVKWWDNIYTGWLPGGLIITHWMPIPEPPKE